MRAPLAVWLSLVIVLGLGSPGGADEPVVAGQNNVPAPKKTKTILPEYPPEAQARGQRGIVIVELVIDTAGKVSSAQVIRSIPPFDEAALAAVRQWEYEVTRVDGKPVSVKLTVPITFAMKIPEIASRQEGIPELRAGAFPPVPADAREAGVATAEVTLSPDGNVEELRIVDGPPAYADALARALRTWRFAPETSEATVTFMVHAEFNPARDAGSKVAFRLDGLRRSESLATATPNPAASGAAIAASANAEATAPPTRATTAEPAPPSATPLPASPTPPTSPPPPAPAGSAPSPTTATVPAVPPPAVPAAASFPAAPAVAQSAPPRTP
ncbi:MAG TPA: TonB family protein, partial [Vicinamibacteria bacterium]